MNIINKNFGTYIRELRVKNEIGRKLSKKSVFIHHILMILKKINAQHQSLL